MGVLLASKRGMDLSDMLMEGDSVTALMWIMAGTALGVTATNASLCGVDGAGFVFGGTHRGRNYSSAQ